MFKMLRSIRVVFYKRKWYSLYIPKQTFLTNKYECSESWKLQTSSSILNKINLGDFYNQIDQTFSTKKVISAIDVDLFANAIRDSNYLDELKDLLHKLRLSAETGRTLQSTHHATVRNFIEFGNTQELIKILQDPLNFGIFLDDFSANILLDKLLKSNNYEEAASVAALIMLQEEYENDITCALCQYACFKYIMAYEPKKPVEAPITSQQKIKKPEEIKIRVKFLRNPYFDDHFDIKDTYLLAGKTLAWLSEKENNNTTINLQIIGWLAYKKYENLIPLCENLCRTASAKISNETIELLNKEYVKEDVQPDSKAILQKCISLLNSISVTDISIEESLTNAVENAINRSQKKDISLQQEMFELWTKIREEKLEEQTKRLDRARRMQLIEKKHKQLQEEEQKLWFFDNEEKIDLEIEDKEEQEVKESVKNAGVKESDEDYIPPEIIPKRT